MPGVRHCRDVSRPPEDRGVLGGGGRRAAGHRTLRRLLQSNIPAWVSEGEHDDSAC